jgi:Tol biopolymer transport system component
MGEVYRAKDTRLGRDVAIKILPKEMSADATRKQRFEREAKTISGLNHPNICTLHDVGSQDGVDYLVMECVEGETLAKRLEKGPLPLEQLLKYGAQMADALDRAHRSGVVHRDLKPGNIMLTSAGVKLLDFGLAKPVEGVASGLTLSMAAVRSSPVTQDGMVVGTFQYMSPEQVEGKELDGRSDIFSLGAVLYEMVTGRRAFEGKSQLSVASAILEKEPAAISEVKPMTPPALDHAIRRCLAKDPDERWQTGRDLAGELKWISESGSQAGVSAVMAANKSWRVKTLGGLAAALAVATLVFAYLYLRGDVSPTATRAAILPPIDKAFLRVAYALSPDGTRLAFTVQTVEGKMSIWVRALDSSVAQELAGTENGGVPLWSPDSQWIAFFADGKLRRIPAGGGTVQVVCDAPAGRGGSWNADGVIVFAPSVVGTLQKVSAGGGTPTPVTQLNESTGEQTHRWPEFLPDGKHFLYLARQPSEKQPSGVYVGSLEGNFRKKVLDGTSNAQYVQPGYLLFVRDETLLAQRFKLSTLSVEGDAIPLATDVSRLTGSLWDGVTASQNGKIVYSPKGFESDLELMVTDRTGNPLSTFRANGTLAMLRISPDGKKVAVAEVTGDKATAGVWIHDLASHLSTRLVLTDASYGSPTWSPDGTQVAFASTKSGPFNMYVKALSGGAEEKSIHTSPEDERPRSWSPDGKYLVYDRRATARRAVSEVMVLPLTGAGEPYSLLNAPYANQAGQVSPDGKWIAFSANQTGKTEIYVTTFPKAKGLWQVTTTGGDSPRWSHDGLTLFYVGSDGVIKSTDVKAGADSFHVGASTEVMPRHLSPGGYQAPFDVFPDGQHFMIGSVREGKLHSPLTLITNWTAELKKK